MRQSGLVHSLRKISRLRTVQFVHGECGDNCCDSDKIPLPAFSPFSVGFEKEINTALQQLMSVADCKRADRRNGIMKRAY